MYKLIKSLEDETIASISVRHSNISLSIPTNSANSDYQQFIQDVAEQGIEIVEGPDIVEPDYATLRSQEYPSREEQFDMMYWDKVNGTTVWEDTIQAIKEKYPKTITGGTTIGEVPAWVQEAADNWTFNKQLREYVAAVERLEKYILSEGRPEVREDVVVETREVFNEETGEIETVNITENVITQTAIEPLEETVEVTEYDPETMESTTTTVPNPLIVKDEEERAAAQEVVDATHQSVIDAFNA
jgi:hypothetical protein